jgi:hypothetical protein
MLSKVQTPSSGTPYRQPSSSAKSSATQVQKVCTTRFALERLSADDASASADDASASADDASASAITTFAYFFRSQRKVGASASNSAKKIKTEDDDDDDNEEEDDIIVPLTDSSADATWRAEADALFVSNKYLGKFNLMEVREDKVQIIIQHLIALLTPKSTAEKIHIFVTLCKRMDTVCLVLRSFVLYSVSQEDAHHVTQLKRSPLGTFLALVVLSRLTESEWLEADGTLSLAQIDVSQIAQHCIAANRMQTFKRSLKTIAEDFLLTATKEDRAALRSASRIFDVEVEPPKEAKVKSKSKAQSQKAKAQATSAPAQAHSAQAQAHEEAPEQAPIAAAVQSSPQGSPQQGSPPPLSPNSQSAATSSTALAPLAPPPIETPDVTDIAIAGGVSVRWHVKPGFVRSALHSLLHEPTFVSKLEGIKSNAAEFDALEALDSATAKRMCDIFVPTLGQARIIALVFSGWGDEYTLFRLI